MKDKEKQFRERVNCGIAYCDDTAINEIKQDFKKHEEENKQIEEIAKDIEKHIVFGWRKELYIGSAEEMYNLGYRKIDKDSVVLSMEEFNDLKYAKIKRDRLDKSVKYYQGLIEDGKLVASQEVEQAIKETAEKIIREIIDKLIARKAIVKSFYSVSESVGIDMAIDEVKKLAKDFAVEIKE